MIVGQIMERAIGIVVQTPVEIGVETIVNPLGILVRIDMLTSVTKIGLRTEIGIHLPNLAVANTTVLNVKMILILCINTLGYAAFDVTNIDTHP